MSKRRTLVLGGAAVASIVLAIASAGNDVDGPVAPTPPALAAQDATCTDDAPAQRATAREAEAEARIARYAFAPSEGVTALALLGEAMACRSRAGDDRGAARLRARRDAWHARIELDYRTHRLRLAHALATGAEDLAHGEADALLALLEAHAGPYTAWLHELLLDLEADRTESQP